LRKIFLLFSTCQIKKLQMSRSNKNRLLFSIAAIVVIIAGLLSRAYANLFPELINVYLGDALYALMVYMGFCALLIHHSSIRVGGISLVFCYAIEMSQLYHAPWIDAIRATRPGGLILGYGFLWSDMFAYALGIGVGVMGRIWFLDPIFVTARSNK